MARPIKYSLEYFPLDVDIFDDEKVIPVSSEYGAQGDAVMIRILCSIYRNGYYIECSESFLYKIAKQTSVSHDIVKGVVEGLVKWNFFHTGVYSARNVITSAGIQKRWSEAVRKRVISTENLPYWIDEAEGENELMAEETQLMAEETPSNDIETTQKKREEKKEKEINKEKGFLEFIPGDFREPINTWLSYKKQRRESYKTEKSLLACYENLFELSRGSPVLAMKIVKKSMANNWAGLFPLNQNELKNDNSSNLQTSSIGQCGSRSSTL
jgi:hypothetical protein